MDYVTRQFIVLAKKLRKEMRQGLSVLHSDLQKFSDAIRSERKRSDQNQQPQLPPPILRAELHIPEDKDGAKKKHEDRQHRVQVWIVIGTWAAFLSASIYAYIAVRQWREMISARHQNQISVQAAQTASETAAKTLNATIDQFRLDQRAWLGVDSVSGSPVLNQGFVIDVIMKNTGKTPARHFSVESTYHPHKKGAVFNFEKVKVLTKPSSAMIPPNSIYKANPPIPSEKVKQGDLDLIKSGEITIYVYGDGTFDDVFSCSHWINFCYYLMSDMKTWGVCSTHNDTGDIKTESCKK